MDTLIREIEAIAQKERGLNRLGIFAPEVLPPGWEAKRLKDVAWLNPEVLPEDTPEDTAIVYIDISNVDSGGSILTPETITFGDAPSRARRIVRDGDTIISTVRTYLKAIAYIDHPVQNLIVSTGFCVLRPRQGVDKRYLAWLLRSEPFIASVVAHSDGVSYPAINPTELGALPVWLPPLDEQRRIVDRLAAETKRIDGLINSRGKMAQLLEEERTTAILQAVTQGVKEEAKLSSRDDDWFPLLPSNWSVVRMKSLMYEYTDPSPNGDEELLTVSHLTGVTRRSEKEVNMIMAESHEGYKRCRTGDLVINTMWAWMGAAGITPLDGMVSPSYNTYRFREGAPIRGRYLDLLLRIPLFVAYMTANSKGIWYSRLRLYPDSFLSMRMPLPPLDEQDAIVERLNEIDARTKALIMKNDRSVELLREYRNAIIDQAVTGREFASA